MSSAGCCTWDLVQPNTEEKTWKKSADSIEEDFFLEQTIIDARKLVSNNYEDEDPKILTPAFERAEFFLRTQSREMQKRLHCFPPSPSITPGPNGSADLHWQADGWGLLVNVPADVAAPATFYGERANSVANRIKGSLDPKTWNLGLVSWLSKA